MKKYLIGFIVTLFVAIIIVAIPKHITTEEETHECLHPQQCDEANTDSSIYKQDPSRIIVYEEKGRLIYLSRDSDLVRCYTEENDGPPRKVLFRNEYYNDGFPTIYSNRYGEDIFIVGDIMPNSNGWTIRYPIYHIDAKTFKMRFVDEGAAVHFDKDGFKIAKCRLVNPDATCTAEEIWMMHDLYYDCHGIKKREDGSEYDWNKMEKIYGDTLVNVCGVGWRL